MADGNPSQKETDIMYARDCLNGNIAAFENLLVASERTVRGMIMGFIKDVAVAEELAQQSFVSAYEKLAQYNGDSSFSTWVCQIALNKCRDYLRKKQPELVDNQFLEQLPDNDSNRPESMMMRMEQSEMLSKAMLKLTTEDREIITFKYICGYDHTLIGEIYRCTPESARTRCFRAKESLRKILMKLTK